MLFADVGVIAEHFGGKEAGHETFEILQQQDQLAAERTERSTAAEHVRFETPPHAVRGHSCDTSWRCLQMLSPSFSAAWSSIAA